MVVPVEALVVYDHLVKRGSLQYYLDLDQIFQKLILKKGLVWSIYLFNVAVEYENQSPPVSRKYTATDVTELASPTFKS